MRNLLNFSLITNESHWLDCPQSPLHNGHAQQRRRSSRWGFIALRLEQMDSTTGVALAVCAAFTFSVAWLLLVLRKQCRRCAQLLERKRTEHADPDSYREHFFNDPKVARAQLMGIRSDANFVANVITEHDHAQHMCVAAGRPPGPLVPLLSARWC